MKCVSCVTYNDVHVLFVFLIQILCQECPLSLGEGRWWTQTALLGVSVAYACGVYIYVACSVCVVAVEIRCMVREREGGREDVIHVLHTPLLSNISLVGNNYFYIPSCPPLLLPLHATTPPSFSLSLSVSYGPCLEGE